MVNFNNIVFIFQSYLITVLLYTIIQISFHNLKNILLSMCLKIDGIY